MSYLFDQFGRPIKVGNIEMVNGLVELKKKSGSDPWPAIEKIIQYWAKKKPNNWKSYLIDIQNLKETRKDPKYASTKDKITGGYLRYTLDIPQEIMLMIRCLYNTHELPMDKKFFREWGKRFPKMMVAEKM